MAAQKSSIAFVYAEALYDVAAENKIVPEVEQELLAVQEALHRDPQLWRFLESPTISFAVKRKIISTTLDSLSLPLRNFLFLVISRERVGILESIVEAYHEHANEKAGIAEFDVSAARALDTGEQSAMEQMLQKKMKRPVVLRTSVNPKLLAGVVLTHKGMQWDSSLSHRLGRLVHKMSELKTAK